jgi:hypothetical protein
MPTKERVMNRYQDTVSTAERGVVPGAYKAYACEKEYQTLGEAIAPLVAAWNNDMKKSSGSQVKYFTYKIVNTTNMVPMRNDA